MSPGMIRGLLKLAMLCNRKVMAGTVPEGWEYETETAYRVILRADGEETDLEIDKVTGAYRMWVNGVELGQAEWN